MKRGEKWFPENYEKIWLRKFSVRVILEGKAPAFELMLLRGSLTSKIALQGGSLESKIVYRGVGADFEKP